MDKKLRLMILVIVAILLVVVAIVVAYSDSDEMPTKRNSDLTPEGTGKVGLTVLPAEVEDKLAEQENER